MPDDAPTPHPGRLRRLADRRPSRRCLVRALLIWGSYAGLVGISGWLVDANPGADWRYAVAVLPMIPLVFALRDWLRMFRRSDELEQRIALESIAFAFGATALLTFTYGLLQLAGLPDINWLFVWAVMGSCWIVGGRIARRRWL